MIGPNETIIRKLTFMRWKSVSEVNKLLARSCHHAIWKPIVDVAWPLGCSELISQIDLSVH